MGEEPPDNLVYAHINPGAACGRQQSRRAEGGGAFGGRAPHVDLQKADPRKGSQMCDR